MGTELWRDTIDRLVFYSLLSLLSYTTQDHLPKGSTTYSVLYLPMSIINQENVLTDLLIMTS